MRNLENKCAWKETVESQIISEGQLKECKKCDGYNTECPCYYTTGETNTKYRHYKVKE